MKTFDLECHCGNLKLAASDAPGWMTSCNCSICNRLGALWAYYDGKAVEITCAGAEHTYAFGEKSITYHRCAECGCTTHYTAKEPDGTELVAVNCRMAPVSAIKGIPVREFDGLVTWRYRDD